MTTLLTSTATLASATTLAAAALPAFLSAVPPTGSTLLSTTRATLPAAWIAAFAIGHISDLLDRGRG